eukprot:m.43351 g.43351  ORF g.43351 m.43351 type:complete len:80 (+) comp8423_c0_seq1:27-266(+)
MYVNGGDARFTRRQAYASPYRIVELTVPGSAPLSLRFAAPAPIVKRQSPYALRRHPRALRRAPEKQAEERGLLLSPAFE